MTIKEAVIEFKNEHITFEEAIKNINKEKVISKEKFIEIIFKLNEYKEKQEKFCDFIEPLEGNGSNSRCDVLIYQDLIDIILYDFLVKELNDKDDIIINKFYNIEDDMLDKFKVMSWEEVYDYLVKENK